MPTMLDLFKGSPQDTQVKRGKETFGTQERDGIRVSTLVEANNPLIYGTGAIRIANRSIETTEIQKDGTGTSPNGGLVGEGLGRLSGGSVNSLSESRTAITSKLGLPQNLIPSRVAANSDFIEGKEPDTIITLSQIRQDGAGTASGQFLKSTGGGNPQTVGRQAVGQGIGLVKDKLREQALGEAQTIGQLTGQPLDTNYSSQQRYTDVLKSEGRNIYDEGGVVTNGEVNVRFGNATEDKVDLRLVSPIYGIDRNDTDGRFGLSEYSYQTKTGKRAPVQYSPRQGYTNTLQTISGDNEPLRNLRGFSGKGDKINQLAPTDNYKREDAEGLGLIPFWVSGLDSTKPVFFRAILSGVNETVSPTWNSSKFVGNPYNFYTYGGVERSLSFTLKLYCMNETELIKNWEKVEYLTKKTYPTIDKELSFVNAPFIKFRLGNMYVDKVAFIESLNYNIDDNSTWETDIDGYLLPKFIDVVATFKFVEYEGIENSLYNYRRSDEAVQQMKEEREEFEERRASLGAIVEKKNVESVNSLGVSNSAEPPTIRKVSKTGKGGLSASPKNINTGQEVKTPKQSKGSDVSVGTDSVTSGDTYTKLRQELSSKYSSTAAEVIANNIISSDNPSTSATFRIDTDWVGWIFSDASRGYKRGNAYNDDAGIIMTKSNRDIRTDEEIKEELKQIIKTQYS